MYVKCISKGMWIASLSRLHLQVELMRGLVRAGLMQGKGEMIPQLSSEKMLGSRVCLEERGERR